MVNVKRMAVIAFLLIFCVGCNKKGTEQESFFEEISINADIAPFAASVQSSQAADGTDAFPADKTFVLSVSSMGSRYFAHDFKIGDNPLKWDELSLPTDSKKIGFSGCYPKIEGSNNNVRFDITEAENKDLLLAPMVEVDKNSVNQVKLSFGHAMHKLTVNYTKNGASSDALAALSTTCTSNTVCGVNLTEGIVSELYSDRGTMTANGGSVTFLLIPQSVQNIDFTATLNGHAYNANLGDILSNSQAGITELKGGYAMSVDVLLEDNGNMILNSFSIGAWGSQGSAGGEIGE